MSLINLVVILIAVGVLLWLMNTQLAQYMDAKIVQLINVVVVIAVVLWIVSLFLGPLPDIRVGR